MAILVVSNISVRQLLGEFALKKYHVKSVFSKYKKIIHILQ